MDPLIFLIVILVVIWLAGVGSFGLMAGGGLLHLLLVIALVVIIVRVMRGQNI